MPFTVGVGPDERRTKAIERLSALHEAGHAYVSITAVLGWLGEEVVDDKPAPSPRADPEKIEIDPADPLAHLALKDARAPGG